MTSDPTAEPTPPRREPNWGPIERLAPTDLLPDLMWMGTLVHGDRRIEQYKHRDSRRYVNVDQDGGTWSVTVPADAPADAPPLVEPVDADRALARLTDTA
ncbi:hypothetical protein [Saccharothrix sp. HUAS TT1]|uniref:hypothetical protein n=1 Tax=unclassified Saccharothrix TaxID=2593673 RepID=UPI00345C1346